MYILIEIMEVLEFIVHYINILSVKKKEKTSQNTRLKCQDIDVIIATINEGIDVLEKNVKSCLKMEYEDKEKIHIYLCDDGNRKEVKELAEKYNVGYITRNDNKDAKAGNYNNALKYLKSKYILTLDADMCPSPQFLNETMYLFEKEKNVGFVQTPQAFENLDIYQSRFGVKNTIAFDQNFFYHYMQPAKNATNTVVYCGTNAIILREALDKIGGFARKTLTEDIATGMLIEAKGYKGIYVDKVLAIGYSPNNLKDFINQRKRWSAGCIQMEKNYHILRQKGLNIRQKLEYLSCVSYWFFPVKTFLYLIAPILFSVFKIAIIDSPVNIFLIMWLPQYILKRFILDKVYSNMRSATWNKIYEIILFPSLVLTCIKEFLGIRKKEFVVTDKKFKINQKDKTNIKLCIGHLIFLGINVISYIFSIKSRYILPAIFSVINIGYLMLAIIFDLNKQKYIEENIDKTKTNIKYKYRAIFKIFKEMEF